MTDSADHRPSTADHASDPHRPRTPPFAPIFTLVSNISTGTSNHPHVRYIFSDDDPDIWTRALAECEHSTYSHELGSDPALANRAMALDITRDDDGGLSVAWASSLSPSWAVLDAQLSQISPPSSDAGHSNETGEAGPSNRRSDRLMLKIEGIETSPPNASSELRRSDETSRQRPGSAGGSGAGQRERTTDADDYASMLDEFEKRMKTLRKVVNASEDRRKKVEYQNTEFQAAGFPTAGFQTTEQEDVTAPQELITEEAPSAEHDPAEGNIAK